MENKESVDSQLINYLKEKDISLEKIKSLIEVEVDTALEKEKVVEEVVPEPLLDVDLKPEETEAKPTFSVDAMLKLIKEEVKKSLKIKRKVPEKGTIVDKTEIQQEPATETKRDVAVKDWFEVIV